MSHITIISSSIRAGRKSHRLALFFQKYLNDNELATVEILDLASYNFPLFEMRLKYNNNPGLNVLEFKNKIISSDGVLIVTPEYNGSIPASLKNVIDLLYEEWQNKPIAISTVSSGDFGGLQALAHLQFILHKIGAKVSSFNYPVSRVHEKFDEWGTPAEKESAEAFAKLFIDAFLELAEHNYVYSHQPQ
jgi:NAD(P)H-dependent FMN reductase